MLDKTITFDRFVRGMLAAIVVVLLILFVDYLSSVLLPFFIAWLFAYLLYPLVSFVQYKLHVPSRVLSIIVTLVAVLAVVVGVTMLIIPPMVAQFERLGDLVTRYMHNTTHIVNFPAAIQEWATQNEAEIRRLFQREDVINAIREAMPKVFSVLSQTAGIVLSVIASFITLLYLFFILLDYEKLSSSVIKIFPPKVRPFWNELIGDVKRELNSYIRGQGLVALCIGILFCIGFTVIGFPMAIGLGILIGILSLVPYMHGLAFVPMLFLSLLESADTGRSFWVVFASAVGVFLVVQIITDMVLTPKIMGKAMGLNPAVLLLSLSVWGSLLGFIGFIIALPLTTLLIAYYKRYVTREENPSETVVKE